MAQGGLREMFHSSCGINFPYFDLIVYVKFLKSSMDMMLVFRYVE